MERLILTHTRGEVDLTPSVEAALHSSGRGSHSLVTAYLLLLPGASGSELEYTVGHVGIKILFEVGGFPCTASAEF